MAQNVIINEVTYNNLPFMSAPKADGQGDAMFWDTSGATINNGAQLRSGVKAVGADGTEYTGSMTEKAAATYKPSANDQAIAANQFLAGAQTIEAVEVTNLNPAYIANGIVVKVGCESDDDCVTSVTGTLKTPVIVQDQTTHGLYIS